MKKRFVLTFSVSVLILAFIMLSSCGGGGNDPAPNPGNNDPATATVDLSTTYQDMIGFGGALTWYCDLITKGGKKNEIAQLIFSDLGTDIIRLKNWYYPLDYPNDKSTDVMEQSFFKGHLDASKELYNLAKANNPSIQVLLSSWGPSSYLKSNGKLTEGTLKKDNGAFMYDEFATYCEDVLNNVGFNPDYFSIQNEPSYVTSGWETCEWRGSQTTDFPGYDVAFDKVHEKIQGRLNAPILIGPEAANIGTSTFGNTFTTFADKIKGKDYLGAYAYHPYNFNNSTDISSTKSALNIIRDNYNNKPNIMTEYSGMTWLKTAQFMNTVLLQANASAYIYWELSWAESSDNAMVKVSSDGNSYELTPFYYVIKHFAKNIDAGYKRVKLTAGNTTKLDMTAYVNPAGTQVTLVIVNATTSEETRQLKIDGKTVTSISAKQSVEGSFYKDVNGLTADTGVIFPAQSITTVVLGF